MQSQPCTYPIEIAIEPPLPSFIKMDFFTNTLRIQTDNPADAGTYDFSIAATIKEPTDHTKTNFVDWVARVEVTVAVMDTN